MALFLVLLLLFGVFNCQYNYLCDYNTFTFNSATSWGFDSDTCEVTVSCNPCGAVAWLPSLSFTTDYTIKSTFSFSSGIVGFIYHAQSISNAALGGEYYFAALKVASDTVAICELNSGFNVLKQTGTHSVSYNNDYELKVVITGNQFDVYLDDSFVFTQSDSTFTEGSIGLRAYNANGVTYKTLYVILPTDEPTTQPITSIPTTYAPTTSEPTTYQPITYQPTIQPTTSVPTTSVPITSTPITFEPTTSIPITSEPTTFKPTTFQPTTSIPTIFEPTSNTTTSEPTSKTITSNPITSTPTIYPTITPKNNDPSASPTMTPITSIDTTQSAGSAVEITTTSSIVLSTRINTGEDDLQIGTNNNILWIIIGIILSLFICFCICFSVILYRKKSKRYDTSQSPPHNIKASIGMSAISTSLASSSCTQIANINTPNNTNNTHMFGEDLNNISHDNTSSGVNDLIMDDVVNDINNEYTTPMGAVEDNVDELELDNTSKNNGEKYILSNDVPPPPPPAGGYVDDLNSNHNDDMTPNGDQYMTPNGDNLQYLNNLEYNINNVYDYDNNSNVGVDEFIIEGDDNINDNQYITPHS